MPEARLVYRPTARQRVFHARAGEGVKEVFYGGAPYGGKSYALVHEMHQRCLEQGNRSVVIFRRTLPQLEEVILPLMSRLAQELGPEWCTFYSSKKRIMYQNGSVFGVRYAETKGDVEKHKGASWDTIGIDEVGDWTRSEISGLNHPLRTTLPGIVPQFLFTSNPWGIGFHWLRDRYVLPARAHDADAVWTPETTPDQPRPGSRCYIPSSFRDNPYVDQSDYEAQLMDIEDPRKRYAFLYGSWDLPADENALFQTTTIEQMQTGSGFHVKVDGHRYVHLWDLGRKRDWTVGITVDVTVLPYQIVAFARFKGLPWPTVCDRMKERHEAYRTPKGTTRTRFDATGVGDATGSFLEIPSGEVAPYIFTAKGKPRDVTTLVNIAERGHLRGPAQGQGIEALWAELSVYRHEDHDLVQDTVMALVMGAPEYRGVLQTAARQALAGDPVPLWVPRTAPHGTGWMH